MFNKLANKSLYYVLYYINNQYYVMLIIWFNKKHSTLKSSLFDIQQKCDRTVEKCGELNNK